MLLEANQHEVRGFAADFETAVARKAVSSHITRLAVPHEPVRSQSSPTVRVDHTKHCSWQLLEFCWGRFFFLLDRHTLCVPMGTRDAAANALRTMCRWDLQY